jgi:hypothetical protein
MSANELDMGEISFASGGGAAIDRMSGIAGARLVPAGSRLMLRVAVLRCNAGAHGVFLT